jgi:alanine racemase
MTDDTEHPTRALIHLERLTHNVLLLREIVGGRPLWPAIKANAYGHGAEIVARHLVALGCDTLCVAHAGEALALRQVGIDATFVILSAALPSQAEAIVAGGFEPVICTTEMADALADAAERQNGEVAVHLKVDTGMGRIGIAPEEVAGFFGYCRNLSRLRVRAVMSHFPRADEADKSYSQAQLERFLVVAAEAREHGVEIRHIANSAAILDLPESHLDAVRPGIAMYGLAPSSTIANPRVRDLRPVLEWRSKITFLKEVPEGTGVSYGHSFHTTAPSLLATLPVGYGDGLHRGLSDSQVGRITMDQSVLDVTALRGKVAIGEDVVIIGRQGGEEATADELAATLGTINYEVVAAIAARVPRHVVGGPATPNRLRMLS